MKPSAANRPNEAFPLQGIGIVQDDRDPTRHGIKSALAAMPQVVDALSPAPAPRVDETLENTPDFAPVAGPAPRM